MPPTTRHSRLAPRLSLKAVAGLVLLSLAALPAQPQHLPAHDPATAEAGQAAPANAVAWPQQTVRCSVAALDGSPTL